LTYSQLSAQIRVQYDSVDKVLTDPDTTNAENTSMAKKAKKVQEPMPTYVGAGVAARTLGVSSDSLRRWAKTGKIDYIRTPGGRFRYNLVSILSKATMSARPEPMPATKRRDPRQLDLIEAVQAAEVRALGPTAAELVAALLAPAAPRPAEFAMPSLGVSRSRLPDGLEHRDME
jgi:ribosomal protein L34E